MEGMANCGNRQSSDIKRFGLTEDTGASFLEGVSLLHDRVAQDNIDLWWYSTSSDGLKGKETDIVGKFGCEVPRQFSTSSLYVGPAYGHLDTPCTTNEGQNQRQLFSTISNSSLSSQPLPTKGP